MLKLENMNEREFRAFFDWNEEEYARDRMRSDFLTFEEALSQVKEQRLNLLAEGKDSPGNYFFKLLEEQDNIHVGSLWVNIREKTLDAFLYYIEIFPKHRQQGYGKIAMRVIEEFSKEKGARALWLNVFGQNTAARKLYLSIDYNEAAIHMNKLL